MERARRTASMASSRRRTNPASHSPQSTPESVSEPLQSVSPSMSNDIKSPQSAPPARRSSKTLQHTSSCSAPASSRSSHSRKRSKTMDEFGFEYGADEIDSPKKGGHTLRRRARVDYTFEHIDDEVVVPNSTSSTRSKKRKSDNSYDSEDFNSQDPAHTRVSLDADTSTSRRRNPARKSSAEVAAYIETPEEPEHKVQDTIEVAGSVSERENSTSPSVSRSNTSSQVSLPAKLGKPDSLVPETSTHEPTDTTRDSATVPEVLASKPQDEDPDRPDNQLRNEAGASLPNGAPSTTSKASQSETIATTAVSEPLSPDASSQQESTTVLAKSEPAEHKIPDVIPVATTKSPEAHEAAAEPNPPTVHESTNGSESYGKGAAQSSSPSSQIQKQLDGSPDDAAAEIKKDPSVDEDVSMTDVVNGELKDEPAEDALRAEPAEKMTTPTPTSEAKDVQTSVPAKSDAVVEDVAPTKTQTKPSSSQGSTHSSGLAWRPQPTPAGRWAYLTPYVEGDTTLYPEKKESTPEDETPAEEPAAEEKDTEKDLNGMEPMVEDNDDAPEAFQAEAPTPALNTPTRGSPVADSMEPTAANSPAPVADEADDGDVSDSDENEPRRYFRYRKLRDPEEYISLLENPETMKEDELYEIIAAVNVSLTQWQTEWTSLGKIVDDYENALRRRAHDAKYEARTRNLRQHGVNYEEPEFVVRGYKAKEKEGISETRYLQSQDRIMAAAYGFEYDPHPSKIGRQNPETQQAGIMTRGRSLRNQPRQTAKATEADEVTGKRTRKPVQLFDPAAQDVSRSSTPVPPRTRRRKAGNGDEDMVTSSFNGDGNSEMDEPPSRTKRRRIGRLQTSAPNAGDDYAAPQDTAPEAAADEAARPIRRGRHRAAIRYDDDFAEPSVDDEQQPKQPKRHLLTLKIPRGKNLSEPSSAITDNGDSRPSTASSDSSSHTAESSYSFRPKRQKRFRDEQEEAEAAAQGPPKKRGRRTTDEAAAPVTSAPAGDATPAAARKTPKIKVVRAPTASRTGTPSSIGGDADEPRKDYKLMTKSEKMSASMKSRWANGNMAGAVEKRKATLAAKKAAQAAADQKSGTTTPKGNKSKPKKDGPVPPQDSQPMPPATPTTGYPFTPA